MISPDTIRQIIAVYRTHGWLLRRVLMSSKLRESTKGSVEDLFAEVIVTDSDIDAIWFSRPPATGGIPWEIRHLSDSPYALLENVDESDEAFEDVLHSVEDRLRKILSSKKAA